MATSPRRSGIRLADLLGALSLATDLGMGQPMEHVLRQSMLALGMAERLGLDAEEREAVYFGSLLAWVGCHIDAYEQAKWFGDDTALKGDYRRADFATAASGPLFMIRHLAAAWAAADRNPVALALTQRAEALARGDRAAVLATAAAFARAGYPYQESRTLLLADPLPRD